MTIFVLDTNFALTHVIDSYESFIWTDRFNSYGDFELYTPMSIDLLDKLKREYYLYMETSDRLMIIEDIQIETAFESGPKLKVTGRSLESILERRVIWNRSVIEGNLQSQIQALLNECIISPSNTNRRISNFVFVPTSDSRITGLTVNYQISGNDLYTIISEICQSNAIGFKIIFDRSDLKFKFSLYLGTDRSYNQGTLPVVVFSPDFDNLLNSNTLMSIREFRNVAIVAGEEKENTTRLYATAGASGSSGLGRREMYVDGGDVKSKLDDDTELSEEEYLALLVAKGNDELNLSKVTDTFDWEVDSSTMFVYGTHYFMGDICQVENEFGIGGLAKVVELIYSDDVNGPKYYPTFEKVEESEE